MTITRRDFVLGTASGLALASQGLVRPSLAQSASEPIRFGWLAALTGPSSAPAIGFDRGVNFAANEINAGGGSGGGIGRRKIEIVTRDTQGDPTKAVNATQEMISRLKVNAIWGPTNSRQLADRSREIPQRLPHRPGQRAVGRGGAQIRP